MKRLTVGREDGRWAIANHEGASPTEQMMKILDVINQLAAYEDTGLTPEEVETMRESKADAQFMLTELCKLCDYDRLCELAQADKDGKLVVVP